MSFSDIIDVCKNMGQEKEGEEWTRAFGSKTLKKTASCGKLHFSLTS